MPDFQKIEKDIYEATKIAFRELVAHSQTEPLGAFARYTDEGAMTVCPAANTATHLAETQKANTDFAADYKFSLAEWAYESEGADSLFNAISGQLSARLDELSADESAFEEFRDGLFTVCFRVLKTLNADGFFETTAGGPVMLLFAVSDADITARDVAIVRELNSAKIGDEYEQWASPSPIPPNLTG